MLRFALVAAAALLAGNAHATTWMDKSCAIGLSSDGGQIKFIDGEKGDNPFTECTLTKPQELTCKDGKKREMVALPDNQVMVDGVTLFAVGESNPAICD